MLSIHLKQSGRKTTQHAAPSAIITRLWHRLVGLAMSVNEDSRIKAVANSYVIKAYGQIITLFAAPIVVAGLLWMGSTLISVDRRLGNIETTVNLKMPDIYPRGEAVQAFATVNARVDGVVSDVQSNSHRVGALEDARNRYK